jgi:hypothetical protein
VRGPTYVIFPAGLRRRLLSGPWQDGWTLRAIAACVAGAAIGSLTHVAWDGFTHAKGQITERWRVLQEPVDVPVIGTTALHRVLQYASTALGLVVLAIVIARLLRRRVPVDLPDVSRVWPRLIFAACTGCGATLLTLRVLAHHLRDPGDLIVGAISGVLAGMIVASTIVQLAFRPTVAAIG